MSLPPWGARKTKPAKDDPISPEVRALVAARSGGLCELCREQRSQHLHHRQLRRAGNHSASNVVDLCSRDHTRIHGHPSWSYENGWLVSQYSDPSSVPLCVGERWMLLSVDGSVRPVTGPASAVGG